MSKLVDHFSGRSSLTSPLAVVKLINITSTMMQESGGMPDGEADAAAYRFLESCLRHKNEMVILEAARAICTLPGASPSDVTPAVVVLQLFLSSPKPVMRFAAVRTLSAVADNMPVIVMKCNEDLESLISDTNRSIATLAITTLLKTGSESSVEWLLKQIAGFMSDISDDFKIVVVNAITQLCMKYPAKHKLLLGFLSAQLREEGGFRHKNGIVVAMSKISEAIPSCLPTVLLYYCEFIEDCEFPSLSAKALHAIGVHGPTIPEPGRLVRFVFNRVILEGAVVRAAAVTALGRFARAVPSLRPSVTKLMSRCLLDDDDEVRDRATSELAELAEIVHSGNESEEKVVGGSEVVHRIPMSVNRLSLALKAYSARPGDGPLSFDALPYVEEVEVIAPSSDAGTRGDASGSGAASTGGARGSGAAGGGGSLTDALYAVPEFSKLGRVFRSCKPVALSEDETEYVVTCIKHVFGGGRGERPVLVLQFDVTNTLNDQLAKDAHVVVVPSDGYWAEHAVVKCDELRYGAPGTCFASFVLESDGDGGGSFGMPEDAFDAVFECTLTFTAVDINPDTGEGEDDEGYGEEFPLEDVELGVKDFMAPRRVPSFRTSWGNVASAGGGRWWCGRHGNLIPVWPPVANRGGGCVWCAFQPRHGTLRRHRICRP